MDFTKDFWLDLALGLIQVYSGYVQVLQEVLFEPNKTAGLNALHLLLHPIFAQNMIYNICCKLLCAAVKPVGQLNCLNDLANQMKKSNSQQVRCPVTKTRKSPSLPDYVPSWQRRIQFTIMQVRRLPKSNQEEEAFQRHHLKANTSAVSARTLLTLRTPTEIWAAIWINNQEWELQNMPRIEYKEKSSST